MNGFHDLVCGISSHDPVRTTTKNAANSIVGKTTPRRYRLGTNSYHSKFLEVTAFPGRPTRPNTTSSPGSGARRSATGRPSASARPTRKHGRPIAPATYYAAGSRALADGRPVADLRAPLPGDDVVLG